MINLFIPALSVFAYWQAMTRLDERAKTTRAGREDGMGKAPGGDALYESDPFRTGAVHALIAFFLSRCCWAMALGYPGWTSSRMSQTVRSIHQCSCAADRVRRVARAGAGTFVQVVRILAVSECAHDGQHMSF